MADAYDRAMSRDPQDHSDPAAPIPAGGDPVLDAHDEEILAFWQRARGSIEEGRVPVITGTEPLDALPPPTWAFGSGAEMADDLLALVLQGRKTATAGALWDYEATDEAVPEAGDLSIVVDGAGHPRALLATTEVDIMPFDEVPASFAAAEGEGDLTLKFWRRVHEEFFTQFADHDREFSRQMPVVCESFTVLYQEPDQAGT